MIAKYTGNEIKNILNKYLSSDQQRQLFSELMKVKGNKSFEDSIKLLNNLIN